MISIQNASLQRGTKFLLEETSLDIHTGHKLGVIGPNGCGKSSLFKLLLGNLSVDAGDCFIPKEWHIAHMAQETHASERSALDYVLDGDQPLRQIQTAIAQLESSANPDGEALGQLFSQLEHIEGYSASARAEQLLHGLGFRQSDVHRPTADFSGGWRIRLNLAQALMMRSDLLLLDEPTNHLDLDATLWLEQWLKQYSGTLLIISHDRDFLDNVINTIISVENQKLVRYSGNYSEYEVIKAQRLAQQQQAFEKQQQRVSEIENFVRRFRAKATKAKQAQSRLKELERMETIAPAHIDSPFHFELPCNENSSSPLMTLEHVDIGYDSKPLLPDVNWSLLPNHRLGLLGPNGAGKTSFIKTLATTLQPLTGSLHTGQHCYIGYYAQHQLESLDIHASAALHIQRMSPKASEQEIRNFLGGFGFHGDRAFETIEHFSGGEKARLALAVIAWQKPNVLLLDEPTNHLDLEMRHALTLALQAYPGAVVIVSHDRHLLRNTVDEFYLIANGTVEPFDGDLSDYQIWLSEYYQKLRQSDSSGNSSNDNANSNIDNKTNNGGDGKVDRKAQRQQAAAQRAQLRPLTNKIQKLEKRIDTLSQQLEAVEEQLADTDLYSGERKDELKTILAQQADYKTELEAVELEWMELTEELEERQHS